MRKKINVTKEGRIRDRRDVMERVKPKRNVKEQCKKRGMEGCALCMRGIGGTRWRE